jgi:hypothetical protein
MRPRSWISRAFSLVDDVVYVGLGTLLALSAFFLLGITALMLEYTN